eukprot:Nk52_evm7s1763 gene=Nk52_evmTU7s1763
MGQLGTERGGGGGVVSSKVFDMVLLAKPRSWKCNRGVLLKVLLINCMVIFLFIAWYQFSGARMTTTWGMNSGITRTSSSQKRSVGVHSYHIWNGIVDDGTIQFNVLGKRIAILYLMKGKDKEINEITQSIPLLQKNFNRRYGYPVIIFYENDQVDDGRVYQIGKTIATVLQKQTESELKGVDEIGVKLVFVGLKFDFPAGFTWDINRVRPDIAAEFGPRLPGYNHMIRFWFKLVFDHPLVRQLDYYLRLDTDSLILSEISGNLFDLGEEVKYAYVAIETDALFVTRGMDDEIDIFVSSHPEALQQMKENNFELPSKEDRDRHEPLLVYNNFEICHVPTFRSPRFVEFVNHIDATHQIYLSRWGDAPLRHFQMKLLLKSNEVKRLCHFEYRHTSHYICHKQDSSTCTERQDCVYS